MKCIRKGKFLTIRYVQVWCIYNTPISWDPQETCHGLKVSHLEKGVGNYMAPEEDCIAIAWAVAKIRQQQRFARLIWWEEKEGPKCYGRRKPGYQNALASGTETLYGEALEQKTPSGTVYPYLSHDEEVGILNKTRLHRVVKCVSRRSYPEYEGRYARNPWTGLSFVLSASRRKFINPKEIMWHDLIILHV